MSTRARIQKGNDRIMKVCQRLGPQYSHVPNMAILPAYGWGTGVDILVKDGIKNILELREVTNFDRFTQYGKQIYISNTRAGNLVKSLTKPLYWKRWGNSRKRFYPTANTQRFLDISYETNLLPQHYPLFKTNGIQVKIWNRTEYRLGYSVEDNNGAKTYFFDNGQPALSKKQII
jgi:hypothetical protein